MYTLCIRYVYVIRMLYVRNNVNEISGGNGAKLIILIDNHSH